VQNKIPSPLSIAKEAAGKDWFKRFMKQQNNNLLSRQPSGNSIVRATGGTSRDFL